MANRPKPQAVPQQTATAAAVASVQQFDVSKGLNIPQFNVSTVRAWFVDSALASGAEASRLEALFLMFNNRPVEEVKTVAKGLKADVPASEVATWTTRASELRTLYGAYRFGGEDFAKAIHVVRNGKTYPLGYHPAIQAARTVLKDKGIKWDGSKRLDADTKKARKQADSEAAAYLAAREAFHLAKNKGLSDDEAEKAEAEALAQAQGTIAKSECQAVVAGLMAKYRKEGRPEFVLEIAEGLISAYDAEVKAGHNKAEQIKAA